MKAKAVFTELIDRLRQRIQTLLPPSDAEQLLQLRQEVRQLARRLPPDGWTPGNYFLVDDPSYSIGVTSDRRWVIWNRGTLVCEAPTLEECIRLFKNVRS